MSKKCYFMVIGSINSARIIASSAKSAISVFKKNFVNEEIKLVIKLDKASL